MTNLREGLGWEEVNQEVTSTAIVSGTNVYGTTSVRSPLAVITTISGTSFVNSEGKLRSVRQGASYGAIVQAGSNTLSAGSNLWVVYPVAFSAAPQSIVATDTKTAAMALFIKAGSVTAGSFYIEGPTASDTFNWIAVGL